MSFSNRKKFSLIKLGKISTLVTTLALPTIISSIQAKATPTVRTPVFIPLNPVQKNIDPHLPSNYIGRGTRSLNNYINGSIKQNFFGGTDFFDPKIKNGIVGNRNTTGFGNSMHAWNQIKSTSNNGNVTSTANHLVGKNISVSGSGVENKYFTTPPNKPRTIQATSRYYNPPQNQTSSLSIRVGGQTGNNNVRIGDKVKVNINPYSYRK